MWPHAFLLLVTVGIAGAATMLAIVAAVRRNRRLLRRAALLTGVVTTGYVLLVAGVAATAPHRVLPIGKEKYICELDCHLAYSVVGVRRQGKSLFVRLNVRFDAASTARRRPADLPVYPGPRVVELLDSRGQKQPPISLGDLRRTLRPGESYQTDLVFELDPHAHGLVLYVTDGDPAKMVLVGSDNGPFRRPTGFLLD